MFKRRLILSILGFITLLSGISFVLLLKYFDPYIQTTLAISFLTFSCISAITSFLALIFYFFKKIYYRGEVGMYHVRSSVRQGFWVALFFYSGVLFQAYHIPYIVPLLLTGVTLILIEFFIQGLS